MRVLRAGSVRRVRHGVSKTSLPVMLIASAGDAAAVRIPSPPSGCRILAAVGTLVGDIQDVNREFAALLALDPCSDSPFVLHKLWLDTASAHASARLPPRAPSDTCPIGRSRVGVNGIGRA